MPQALRRLPIGVRPRPGETIGSYVVRLAHANHLRPDHLHAYLCGPPGWRGAVDPGRLAVCCGRPVAILQRALTGPDTATRAKRAKGRVDRKVDPNGAIGFDGAPYPVGRAFTGQTVQVTCQDGTVRISRDGQPLRTWPVKVANPASLGRWGELALDQLLLNGDLAGTADRKVASSGSISFADATYPVGRRLAGQTVQVGCVNGVVQLIHDGKLVRAWARRHAPAKEASIQPDRSHNRGELTLDHAARLAPLGDLASDPRVVRRRVDPNGAVSFAGRYYAAGRRLAGHVVQVRFRQRHRPAHPRRRAGARLAATPHARAGAAHVPAAQSAAAHRQRPAALTSILAPGV
jgi:hypothetical protein